MVEPDKTPRERAEDLMSLLFGWRPTPQQGVWAIRIAVVLVVLIAIGYAHDITLWDWAKLLIVPAVIAAGGLWFNAQQQERQREDDQRQRARGQEIEYERSLDEALQAYLDQIGQLLLEKNLRNSKEGDEVRSLARARTLTVLTTLLRDSERKGNIVLFLYESGLITKDCRVLDLSKADLSKVGLSGADLSEANLNKAYLIESDLILANLSKADLSGAAMYAASLSRANLSKADLSKADLVATNLSEANLSEANLYRTSLRRADLSKAQGWTEEQLKEAKSLEGATMPNGQKYEEWLKDQGDSSS